MFLFVNFVYLMGINILPIYIFQPINMTFFLLNLTSEYHKVLQNSRKNFALTDILSLSKKANFEYAHGWNRYTMMFIGIWPENRNFGRVSSYKAIIPILTMFCFVCAPQSANLFFIWGDFDLVIENFSMANMTITISLLKTIIFWSKGGCKYTNFHIKKKHY